MPEHERLSVTTEHAVLGGSTFGIRYRCGKAFTSAEETIWRRFWVNSVTASSTGLGVIGGKYQQLAGSDKRTISLKLLVKKTLRTKQVPIRRRGSNQGTVSVLPKFPACPNNFTLAPTITFFEFNLSLSLLPALCTACLSPTVDCLSGEHWMACDKKSLYTIKQQLTCYNP